MPVEVRVPALGESVVEATVGQWARREGDAVKAGDPLVQLETEKVNVDVAAERAGVLETIRAGAGETVHVGDVRRGQDAFDDLRIIRQQARSWKSRRQLTPSRLHSECAREIRNERGRIIAAEMSSASQSQRSLAPSPFGRGLR